MERYFSSISICTLFVFSLIEVKRCCLPRIPASFVWSLKYYLKADGNAREEVYV
jgi:hypothetical protein